jgi:hypothetical protein
MMNYNIRQYQSLNLNRVPLSFNDNKEKSLDVIKRVAHALHAPSYEMVQCVLRISDEILQTWNPEKRNTYMRIFRKIFYPESNIRDSVYQKVVQLRKKIQTIKDIIEGENKPPLPRPLMQMVQDYCLQPELSNVHLIYPLNDPEAFLFRKMVRFNNNKPKSLFRDREALFEERDMHKIRQASMTMGEYQDFIPQLSSLESLQLVGSSLDVSPESFLENMPATLRKLGFAYNYNKETISHDFLKAILGSSKSSQLQELDLSYSKDFRVPTLFTGENFSKFTHLNLQGMLLADESIKTLIPHLTHIQWLNLSHNHVNKETAEFILANASTTLYHLCLSVVNNEALVAVKVFADKEGLPNLTYLSIKWCERSIEQDIKTYFHKKKPNLQLIFSV